MFKKPLANDPHGQSAIASHFLVLGSYTRYKISLPLKVPDQSFERARKEVCQMLRNNGFHHQIQLMRVASDKKHQT